MERTAAHPETAPDRRASPPTAASPQAPLSGTSIAGVLALQRRAGNAAVGRLLGPRLLQRAVMKAGVPGARPNLVVGDSGPGVDLLQRRLGVKVTGLFDQPTRKAVDEFQRQQGWEPSGVGSETWKRIDNHAGAPGARPNLVEGLRGPGVALLQRILGVTETGYFGPGTRKAVDAFQKRQGWAPSGVGLMTWERLEAFHAGPIRDAPDQRRHYTPAEYEEMWEKEQGRTLTPEEKNTIDEGCIGITANNLHRRGYNPPLDEAYSTFERAYRAVKSKNAVYDWMRQRGETIVPAGRYVLFGKLFWANQDTDEQRRKKSNSWAFRPDPTGRVDMSSYAYLAQPGFVNYDYGFWDEASGSFWHANHMDYGDPADPMRVLQSTKERFAKRLTVGGAARFGYRDFDRVVYAVALAENYDPQRAAMAHALPAPAPAPVPAAAP